ncbi:hypothetical protein P280DRAFT_59405 [Massarina eburnea CBS 473.64]|uniref:Uncharacterized protein n=1 Tax=Massarina eburnea CBS 473.64 TaxID=1395130 RepID=A0A6A6RX75_9PLEO|nr:hypothetical protein P280DRAFT_59405 [Massarina eburnea CBS 473.64]
MMSSAARAFLSLFLIIAVSALPSPHHHPGDATLPLFPRQASAPSASAAAEPGEQASLFACENVFWGGKCAIHHYTLGSGDCSTLDGKTSAVGPDAGFKCTFYKNGVCRDLTGTDSITLVHPGSPNLLSTERGNFNDALLSYQCWKE